MAGDRGPAATPTSNRFFTHPSIGFLTHRPTPSFRTARASLRTFRTWRSTHAAFRVASYTPHALPNAMPDATPSGVRCAPPKRLDGNVSGRRAHLSGFYRGSRDSSKFATASPCIKRPYKERDPIGEGPGPPPAESRHVAALLSGNPADRGPYRQDRWMDRRIHELRHCESSDTHFCIDSETRTHRRRRIQASSTSACLERPIHRAKTLSSLWQQT